jgi:uncharacterized protein with NRDE domain
MCTVTYIPLNSNLCCITSNRDETPKRQPEELFFDANKNLLYPKEPSHGGSWICVSGDNRAICLLNGAFEKHQHKPPYRKSRGLVVLDFFESDSQYFFNNYNLIGIEPFTLIIVDDSKLYEFRWDASKKHILELDATLPYIWSSSTLYNDEMKKLRQEWFDEWLSRQAEIQAEDILKFHQSAGNGDPEISLMMNRNNFQVCTVSVTQIQKNQDIFNLKYFDVINNTDLEKRLELFKI